MVGLVGYDP